MRRIKFDVAVATILKTDNRYNSEAYFFLRDALDYTVKTHRADELIEHRHVSGKELLEGLKEHALKQYKSMALAVLESWGVKSGKDIGQMVYNLIQVEAFGKSEDDHPADFEGWMTFEEAFRKPFQPTRPVLVPSLEDSENSVDSSSRGNKPAKTSEA